MPTPAISRQMRFPWKLAPSSWKLDSVTSQRYNIKNMPDDRIFKTSLMISVVFHAILVTHWHMPDLQVERKKVKASRIEVAYQASKKPLFQV